MSSPTKLQGLGLAAAIAVASFTLPKEELEASAA